MNIVFVHLNTVLPRYLILNIKAHISKFPGHKVVLIHNTQVHVPYIEKLETYLFSPGEEWNTLNNLYTHKKDFRGNFWLTSTARFFALRDYIEDNRCQVLHLESDVVISRDFPFDKFTEIKERLAYPIISNERGVASVLYLKNYESAKLLTSIIIPEARRDPGTTEMLMLKKLFDSNPTQVRILPIGPKDESSYRSIPIDIWGKMADSFHFFEGCFDGVDLGQYFFGTDPRNRRGKVLFRQDIVKGYANVSLWSLGYSKSREFPEILLQGESKPTKVFALHLPSKKKALFSARLQSRYFIRFSLDSKKGSRNTFYKWAFITAVFDAIARRLGRYF